MNNKEHYTEIDLTALLKALWRHIWLIAASVIVIGAMAFSYARFFVTPMYTASALMYVNNNSLSVGSTKVSLSAGDLSAAKSLVNTYVVILNARTTMNEVIREAGVDYTYTDMQGMISAGAVNSTEVVQIDVTMPDPQEAALPRRHGFAGSWPATVFRRTMPACGCRPRSPTSSTAPTVRTC